MFGIRPFGFAIAAVAYVAAQSTQPIATCTNSSFQWSFNSLGQSPCVMGAWLGGVCNGGTFNVPPLQPGFVYLGPTQAAANKCRCSSVFYSVISVCGLCQSEDFLKWSAYKENCTTVYESVFPLDLPSSTKIPHWAYLDVSASDQFLPAAASAAANAPESTASGQSTSSSTFSSSSNRPSSSSSPSSNSGSKKSNAGAIAGGVVGGVVGLALIAALAFLWTRRRRGRGHETPTATTLVDPNPMPPPATPMTYHSAAPLATAPSPKLYDPSDPTTFPSSPAPTGYSSHEYQHHPPNQFGTTYHTPGQGHYSGAPEL